MMNETLAQWFETLEDERHAVLGGTWANAWSPVWEEKKAPVGHTSSESTQSLLADIYGETRHHG